MSEDRGIFPAPPDHQVPSGSLQPLDYDSRRAVRSQGYCLARLPFGMADVDVHTLSRTLAGGERIERNKEMGERRDKAIRVL